MNSTVATLGKRIRDAVLQIAPPAGAGRPSTKAIYEALKTVRPVLKNRFGGPVRCRYAGCPPVSDRSHTEKPRKVLEYLWDFSFSRFDIPQAIEQTGYPPLSGGKYELLFVVESELGTADEICRDLLKLVEARASVRCLVYKQPKRPKRRKDLHSRIIRILHHHAHFAPRSEVNRTGNLGEQVS